MDQLALHGFAMLGLNFNKKQDAKAVIKWIFNHKTEGAAVERLLTLQKFLNDERFQYLKEHNWFSNRFAVVNGKRIKTSGTYANIQRAIKIKIAASCIKDNTNLNPLVSKEKEVLQILKTNNKSRFHFFASNTFGIMDDQTFSKKEKIYALEKSRQDLADDYEIVLPKLTPR